MDAHVTFIESFYEKLFPVKQDNKKCFIWPTVLLLVLLLIVLWLSQGTDWLSESGLLYLNAAPVLCTVVFWPFIIIDISYRFHDTYKAINELVKEKKKRKALSEWYQDNAKASFTFCRTDDRKKSRYYLGIILNIFIIISIACLFIHDCSAKMEQVLLFAFIVLSAVFGAFILQQRNLSITLFTVCCGLAYYVYLFDCSNEPLHPMFKLEYLNNISLIIIVIIFFIAGSAICPMIGALFAFYNDLPKVINPLTIKPTKLTQGIDCFKTIRQYFAHLAIISLVAYFQLFGIVYIMGIINKSDLTVVLFALGSLFPLLMYCASDIMYKRFMHKQYLQYIKTIHIDKIIHDKYNDGNDMETVQLLVALKEKLSVEFEERPNIKLIVALVSPIIAAIASIIHDFI